MSWNGSSSAGASVPAPKKPAKKSPGLTHGLIAGGAIVLIGVISLYFVTSEPDEQPADKKSTMIAEVDADIAEQTSKVSQIVVEKKVELGPQKVGETRDGKILLPSGRLHVVKGVVTNDTSRTLKGSYEIFDYACDNEIACLLTIQPGEGLVGTPRYNGRFKKEFLESLKTPIVIDPNDSEEDRELKRNVRQAKVELKEALDRGEDIEQIMLDTRAEYQKLAMYKNELLQQVREAHANNQDFSLAELEDLVGAANKMLEDKGIAPLKYGPLIKQKMLMMRDDAIREVK